MLDLRQFQTYPAIEWSHGGAVSPNVVSTGVLIKATEFPESTRWRVHLADLHAVNEEAHSVRQPLQSVDVEVGRKVALLQKSVKYCSLFRNISTF